MRERKSNFSSASKTLRVAGRNIQRMRYDVLFHLTVSHLNFDDTSQKKKKREPLALFNGEKVREGDTPCAINRSTHLRLSHSGLTWTATMSDFVRRIVGTSIDLIGWYPPACRRTRNDFVALSGISADSVGSWDSSG